MKWNLFSRYNAEFSFEGSWTFDLGSVNIIMKGREVRVGVPFVGETSMKTENFLFS